MRLRISFNTSAAMAFCLALSLPSRPSNHFFRAFMSSLASCEMLVLSIRKCSDSFFRRAPPHSGQVFTTVKSSTHFRMASDPSSFCFCRKLMIPSNLVFHSVPGYLTEATATGTLSPYNNTFSTSLGMSLMGVERAALWRLSKASTFLKIHISRYPPRGSIPPRLMLKFLSGIMDASVISSIWPRPLHTGHAP